MRRRRRWALRLAVAALGTVLVSGVVAAHGGSLGGQRASLSVPLWLFLLTGGAAVGASFLLASFVTDRSLIREIHAAGRELELPRGLPVAAARAAGVLGLVAVVAVGLFGPAEPLSNLGVLVVWVGWWAGYTMSVYLLGNSWPVLNPWRTLAGLLPSLDRPYPERLGAWPATIGLLALIWLEVVSPVAESPRLLATVVLAYTVATLAGAVVFGADTWFGTIDPVSQVFRWYGRVAPLGRAEGGLAFRLPGSALADRRSPAVRAVADGGAETGSETAGLDEMGFVVALLWATTYDGFVATTAWRSLAGPLVGAGVPAALLYPLALAAGFGLFLGVYWLAADYGRRYADTYRSTAELARRFAPSLVAIAAGYHAAHYLSYFIELSPALAGALANPLAPATPQLAVLPDWFGVLGLVAVLVGHWLAVWVAHATAFELFPGRMQAIRSQYPLAGAMVLFTMSSLFVVAQPTIPVPFL